MSEALKYTVAPEEPQILLDANQLPMLPGEGPCKGQEEVFDATIGVENNPSGRRAQLSLQIAKGICAICPPVVKDQCLKNALELPTGFGEPLGVWAGLSEDQIRTMRNRASRRRRASNV